MGEIQKVELHPQFTEKIEGDKDLAKFAKQNQTEVERIASNYSGFMIEVQEHMDILKTLKLGDPEDAKIARKSKAALGKIKSAVDTQKDEDKEEIKVKGNFIQSLRNTVWNAAYMTQEELKKHIEYEENLEKERLKVLQEERVALLSPYVEDAAERDLASFEEDVWDAYLEKKQKEYHDRIEAEQEAERKRKEQEEKEDTLRERQLEIAKFGRHAEEQPTIDTTEGEWVEMKVKAQKNLDAYEKEQEKIRKEKEELEKQKAREEKERQVRSDLLQPYIVFIRDYNALMSKPEKEFQKELKDLERAAKEQREYEAKIQVEKDERRTKAEKFLEKIGYKKTHGGYESEDSFTGEKFYNDLSSDEELEDFCNDMNQRMETSKKAAEERRRLAKLEAERKAEEKAKAIAKAEEERIKKLSADKQIENWISKFTLPEAPVSNTTTKEIEDKFSSFKRWASELLKS